MTLLAAPHVGAQIVPQEGDLVLLGGVLWDGASDASRPNPGILIRNGTILTVGRVDAAGSGADVMSLGDDAFIMPGLFDLHAHYAVDLFAEGRVDEYTVNPVLFLANGVTSTFPAGHPSASAPTSRWWRWTGTPVRCRCCATWRCTTAGG